MLNFSIQVKKYILIFFINVHISDTDSFYIQFEDYDWDKVLTILEDQIDFSNFEKSHERYSSSRKAMFGFVKVDTGTDIIHAFLGERKKSYQLFTDKTSPTVNSVYDLDRKTVKKGCPKGAASKLKTNDILGLIKQPGILKAQFKKLQSKRHIISMIKQEKRVSSSFDNSAFYKSCGLCNVPFFCTIKDIEICQSIDCRQNNLLVNIWHRLTSDSTNE